MFKDNAFDIYRWFVHIKFVALLLMPTQGLSNTHIFFLRHITAFSHLGTLESSSAYCLEGRETTNKKHKNEKKKKSGAR